jgi:acyl dehydratase
LRIGDALPPLERTLLLKDLVAYAGATWDWNGTHYDPAVIARLKLPGALVDGQMLGALLAQQATAWAGPQAFVRRMSFRFKSMVIAGDTVRCEGEVTGVDGRTVTLGQRVMVGDRTAVEPATMEIELRS